MLSYKMDFSSCAIMPGFGKSSHNRRKFPGFMQAPASPQKSVFDGRKELISCMRKSNGIVSMNFKSMILHTIKALYLSSKLVDIGATGMIFECECINRHHKTCNGRIGGTVFLHCQVIDSIYIVRTC